MNAMHTCKSGGLMMSRSFGINTYSQHSDGGFQSNTSRLWYRMEMLFCSLSQQLYTVGIVRYLMFHWVQCCGVERSGVRSGFDFCYFTLKGLSLYVTFWFISSDFVLLPLFIVPPCLVSTVLLASPECLRTLLCFSVFMYRWYWTSVSFSCLMRSRLCSFGYVCLYCLHGFDLFLSRHVVQCVALVLLNCCGVKYLWSPEFTGDFFP